MVSQLGGRVDRTGRGEYGRTELIVVAPGVLDFGQATQRTVWMSHFDSIATLPTGWRATAQTESCPVAAFENPERRFFGTQFHVEVGHTEGGQQTIERFLVEVCGASQDWTMSSVIDQSVAAISEQARHFG